MPFDFLSNPILNRGPGALARNGTELRSQIWESKHPFSASTPSGRHPTSKHHHIFSSITVPITALSFVKLAIS
jgi:hypothetical protein